MTVVDWFLEPAPERPRAAAPAAASPAVAPVAEAAGSSAVAPLMEAGASSGVTAAAKAAAGWTTAAVLGAPEAVGPMAGAVAAVLRRRARARAAVVVRLPGGASSPPADLEPEPAARGVEAGANAEPTRRGPAAALAARLDAHGVRATARGRLAEAELARDGFAAAVHRAAACGAPLVLAVLRPRSPEIDALLAGQDVLVLTAADPAGPLAALAQAELAQLGPRVVVVPPLPGGAAGALQRAGRLLGRLDGALTEAAAATS